MSVYHPLFESLTPIDPYWSDEKTMEDESTLEDWNKYVAVNLTAPFVISQACIPFMKRQDLHMAGPCIIHVSSFRALISDPNQEGYASTKGKATEPQESSNAISRTPWIDTKHVNKHEILWHQSQFDCSRSSQSST